MTNILFVCTGNSCRSVMAEAIFKSLVKDRAHEFNVLSAGISAIDGFGATQDTIRTMQEAGLDVSQHRSRRLTFEMVRQSHYIFVMEELHRDLILRLVPDAKDKIALLTDYCTDPEFKKLHKDIPDPIRMSESFYKNVREMIQDCVQNIVKTV